MKEREHVKGQKKTDRGREYATGHVAKITSDAVREKGGGGGGNQKFKSGQNPQNPDNPHTFIGTEGAKEEATGEGITERKRKSIAM